MSDETEKQKDLELQEKIKRDIDEIRADGYDVYLTIKAMERLDMLIDAVNQLVKGQKAIAEILILEEDDLKPETSPSENLM